VNFYNVAGAGVINILFVFAMPFLFVFAMFWSVPAFNANSVPAIIVTIFDSNWIFAFLGVVKRRNVLHIYGTTLAPLLCTVAYFGPTIPAGCKCFLLQSCYVLHSPSDRLFRVRTQDEGFVATSCTFLCIRPFLLWRYDLH